MWIAARLLYSPCASAEKPEKSVSQRNSLILTSTIHELRNRSGQIQNSLLNHKGQSNESPPNLTQSEVAFSKKTLSYN